MGLKFLVASLIVLMSTSGWAQPAYTKNFFVKKLMKRDLKIQQRILERRILMAINKKTLKEISALIDYYFDPSIDFKSRDKFIEKIVTSKKYDETQKTSFLENCGTFDCHLWAAESLNQNNVSMVKKWAVELFRPEKLEDIISHKKRVEKVLRNLVRLNAKKDSSGDVLFYSRHYGFYSVGLEYFAKNPKEIKKSQWSHLDYCMLLVLDQKNQKANTCLSERSDPLFKLQKMSLQSLDSKLGQFSREEFEKVKASVLGFNDRDVNLLMTVSELLMYKDKSKIDFTSLPPEHFSNDYFYGFMVLKIMKKIKNKPTAWLEKVDKAYQVKYKDSFLLKVLQGKKSPSGIVSHFGPNAPISRALSL